MKIQDLHTLEWMNVDSKVLGTSFDSAIQGGSRRPTTNTAASGIAIAGAKATAQISGYKAYYQATAAAGAAAAGAATVNGPAAVIVGVGISY